MLHVYKEKKNKLADKIRNNQDLIIKTIAFIISVNTNAKNLAQWLWN